MVTIAYNRQITRLDILDYLTLSGEKCTRAIMEKVFPRENKIQTKRNTIYSLLTSMLADGLIHCKETDASTHTTHPWTKQRQRRILKIWYIPDEFKETISRPTVIQIPN